MIDHFGRQIEILRISVTDRCNYRCVYCMPPEGVQFIPHEKILRFEEIVDVVKVAVSLGITKFRLTGGEPLARSGIVELVRKISRVEGVAELAMTTNGSLLAPVAGDLKSAGLDRVNISLDTMDPKKFTSITRGGKIEDVIAGIDAAAAAGLQPVKLNIVVTPEEGDGDARAVEAFARNRNLVTRRILKMDIRNGTFSVVENSDRGDCKVCNRLRLTSHGYIRSCLLADVMFNVREYGIHKAFRNAADYKPESGCGTEISYMGRIGG